MSTNFDYTKHIVSRESKEIVLKIGEEELTLKVRDIPKVKKDQIVAEHLRWDPEGSTHFDTGSYIRECLKYMIVEAPWGATTDAFLLQLKDDELYAALEKLVPTAFTAKKGNTEVLEAKKEL